MTENPANRGEFGGILWTDPVIGPGRTPHLMYKINMVVSERIGYNHGRWNQEWAFIVDNVNFGRDEY
jgi:hypothetical protein